MSKYVALKTESMIWTVGSYSENGRFDPIKDFSFSCDAQNLCDILNSPVRIMQMVEKLEQQQDEIDHLKSK